MYSYRFLLFFYLLLGAVPSLACDVCGCGVGSNYLGLQPGFGGSSLGLRYRHTQLRTHLGLSGRPSYLTATEYYQSAELVGSLALGKRWRLTAQLPLTNMRRVGGTSAGSSTGLSDGWVQGFYRMVQRQTTLGGRMLMYSAYAGLGAKMPLGRYQPSALGTQNANLFQLGSGSWDAALLLNQDLRYNNSGLALTAQYRANTANGAGYRYGNKWSQHLQLYHKISLGKAGTFSPVLGWMFDAQRPDEDAGLRNPTSGGRLHQWTAGLEWSSPGPLVAGMLWQQPWGSGLLAAGTVKVRAGGMVHVGWRWGR